MAAAFGRTSSFCGAVGLDIMEPLTFKGREGSGMPGGRCAYADTSLNPKSADWEKFEYFYRVWGRWLYNPDSDPETWRRYLKSNFGAGANSVETALANASRVLPLVTSAHLASASNHAFWPEIYDNMPIVLGSEASPYSDTPSPKCFGTVSPLDPQLFSTIVDHVGDLLDGRANPKYSPIEVAQWLEDYTAASSQALASARLQATSHSSPAFRRIEEDVLIQMAWVFSLRPRCAAGSCSKSIEGRGMPRPASLRWRNTRRHATPGPAWRSARTRSTTRTLLMETSPCAAAIGARASRHRHGRCRDGEEAADSAQAVPRRMRHQP